MASSLPVVKTLIEYNRNSLEESDEEEKEPINFELSEQNQIPIIMINGIDFKWSGVKEEEEDVALANFIESLQKQTDEEIFKKK